MLPAIMRFLLADEYKGQVISKKAYVLFIDKKFILAKKYSLEFER